VISSFDDALVMLRKYKEEHAPVWFSMAAGGFFLTSNGLVVEVSETSLKLDAGGVESLILWKPFEVGSVEYFEPRAVPPEWLSAFMAHETALESLWRFSSSRPGLAGAVLLLGVLAT